MKIHSSDKEIHREVRPIGLVFFGGGEALPSFYMKYEVIITYKNKSQDLIYQETKIGRGKTINTVPGFENLNGTKKQKEKANETYKPEFYELAIALPILLQTLQYSCQVIDQKEYPTLI